MTVAEQATLAGLFEEDGLVWEEEMVRVDELPDTEHVDVRRDLRDSIRDVGVLVPVLLAQDGKRLTIVDGRHRIAAARAVGEREVPARIAVLTGSGGAALTLIANTQRSANVIAEYDAIVRLMSDGSNENEIARLTGIAVGTIRKRLKIASLNDALMARFRAGEMSGPAAEAAATLPAAHQDRLAEATADLKKVRYRDVHDVRQVAAADAAALLPGDIFGAGAPETPPTTPNTSDTSGDVSGDPVASQGYIPESHFDGVQTIIAVASVAIENTSTKGELIEALKAIRDIARSL